MITTNYVRGVCCWLKKDHVSNESDSLWLDYLHSGQWKQLCTGQNTLINGIFVGLIWISHISDTHTPQKY